MLIDTGCSLNILKPDIIEYYFPNAITSKPTRIKTAGGTVVAQGIANIPLLWLIIKNSNNFGHLQNYVDYYPECVAYNFHNYFDGVLGINFLRDLNLNIDFKNQKLISNNFSIPFQYRQENKMHTFNFMLNPHEIKIEKLPVNIQEGKIFINEQRWNNVTINNCVTTATNGQAYVEIENKSNSPQSLEISTGIPCKNIDHVEHELFTIEQVLDNNYIPDFKPIPNLDSLIRTNHLNSDEKSKLLKLCYQFKEIFHKSNEKLTVTDKVQHHIRTTDNIPTHPHIYKYPHVHKELVKQTIDQYLQDGIIRHSQSPYAHPIWIVDKKLDASGKRKYRMVIDYSALNAKTIDDKYPLPDIDATLTKLGKSQYFTTIDLASGYHQIAMHKESIEKTAFTCDRGHYEFLRMPFGLKNAPATFQRVMDHVLRDLITDNICMVYLDDIIVYSVSLQEHLVALKRVFTTLRQSNLKIQLDKTEFLKREAEYLGHIISDKGVRPNPKKISAIQNFPIPQTTKQIKSFLGLTGYYRKFIKNYAKIAKPMTNFLKKGSKININNVDYKNSFETLKNYLTNEPILAYPDFKKPFTLTADSSNFAIGAVLSQSDKPICYGSRTLNKAEINYSVIEKELLAIIYFSNYWKSLLYGNRFTIQTDHKPLKWLTSIKEPNSRLLRWKIKMQEFNYDEITYVKGKDNLVADALSRIRIESDNESTLNNYDITENNLADFFTLTNEPQITPSTSKIDQIINEAISGQESTTPPIKIISNITLIPEKPVDTNETVHTARENPVLEIPISENAINTFKNQVNFHVSGDTLKSIVRIEQPFENKTRHNVTLRLQHFDVDLVNFLKDYLKPNTTYGILIPTEFLSSFTKAIQTNFLAKSFKFVRCTLFLEDIKTKDEQILKLKYHHETKTIHRGINETTTALTRKYYWPTLKRDVNDYINLCAICQKTKYERQPHKIIFKNTPIGDKPFDHIYIDTFQIEKVKFLTIIDSFSRFAQAYPTTTNAIDVVDNILKFISHYGIPTKITCDQGPEFKNRHFENLCTLHKINLHYTTAKNPNSNSPVERLHSSLIESLRILRIEQKNNPIASLMIYALIGYNNTIHSSTKFTPMQIVKGILNHATPTEITEPQIVSDYLNKHVENTNVIYRLVSENNSKSRDVTKINENRIEPPEIHIDSNKNIYVKDITRNKIKPIYQQAEPLLDDLDKLITDKGTFHKKIVKPIRKVTKNKSLLQEENEEHPGASSCNNLPASNGCN